MSRAGILLNVSLITLLVVGSALFATGNDDWKRSLLEPSADDAYYYVYLPSIVLDGDLDFADEYAITKNWYRLGPTGTGLPGNVFGIGPAVFQLPAFLVGHGVALATGSRRDGFSRWETGLVLWTGIPFSLGALLLVARIARRRISKGATAYVGPLVALLAGPVCYYAIRQPGYSHPYATFFVALLVERWDASFDSAVPRSLRVWLVLGAALGAAALARPQLVLWGVIFVPALLDDVKRREGIPAMRIAGRWAAGAAVTIAVFSPQLVAWKVLYGSWYVVPQGPGFMWWDDPAWLETLFSSRNGLFSWSPLYMIMLVSLLWLRSSRARIATCLGVGLLLQAVVNGAAWDWWGGGSFGGRRFDSAYVVFALGAAAGLDRAFEWIKRGAPRAAGWRDRARLTVAAIAIVVAGLVTVAQVRLMYKTSVVSARITGGESAATIFRKSAGGVSGSASAWLSRLVTLPVRAVFAWRHDVGLNAYDRMAGVHLLGETFPGLNSYSDKTKDVLRWTDLRGPRFSGLVPAGPAKAEMTGDHARLYVGLNRRGSIRLRIIVRSEGLVRLFWNDHEVESTWVNGVEEVETRAGNVRRGGNWLVVRAPPGTILSEPELFAEP